MKTVPITEALLDESSLLAWFRLRKQFDGHPSHFEYIIVFFSMCLSITYTILVILQKVSYSISELKETSNILIDLTSTVSGSALAVLLPSFAIFMALGQTKNVSYLATIEDADSHINYLKKVIFPFIYASTISLCILFVAISFKIIVRFFWPSISGLSIWPISFLLCLNNLCILSLLMLGCVMKDFLFNMVHIIMFIIINSPKDENKP